MKVIAIIKTADLKRLIKATAKFISKDENRHMLHWIKLEFNKEGAKAVACDGYKVSVENSKCISVDEDFTVFVKPYLPVGAKAEYSQIELVDGRCLIDIGGRIASYVQPEGEYLNTDKVIADIEAAPVTSEVSLNRDFLIDALKSLDQEKNTRIPVIIQLRDNFQPVSVKMCKSTRYILPVRTSK